MNTHPQGRHFFYVLFAAVAILCILIFHPFFIILVLGASLAAVFNPLYLWFKNKVTRGISWLAALLTTLLFIIIIVAPLFFIGSQVIQQAGGLFESLSRDSGTSHYIDSLSKRISSVSPAVSSLDIKTALASILRSFTGSIASIFTATLSTIFSFLLVILSLFYFLKDGDKWKRYIIKISPLADNHDNKILTMLENAVSGIMKGYLFVAFIQGTLLGIGLWIFGVPHPALWGLIAGIASVIPTVGTAIVAIPAVIYLYVSGATGPAIGLAVWSLTLVGTIDNLLNPIVMGKKVSLPPLVILFAILGGIALVGPVGIIIGPLSVSLLYTLLLIYQKNFEEK